MAQGPGQGQEQGGLESMEEGDDEDDAGLDVDRALLFVYGLVREIIVTYDEL